MSEQEASPRAPSTPLRWRVRVCRWLWRVLAFVWSTLIVSIVIGTIANFNTTTTDTPLAKLYLVHLAQTYPLPVWSSLGLLLTLTLLSWIGSRDKQSVPAFPLSASDRAHMLRRLRVRYEQVLAQSLEGAVQVELELASRPAAVQNAISLSLRLPDQPEQLLPPHTSIVEAYELAQQELLILGEPGAGKSTLLVELAHCLVEQAEQDETRPLPILLPLSTWAATWAVRQRPLDEWLSDELARLYDISPRLSRQYIQAEQVLPLLDGLDEMKEAARPGCVTAINAYHREHLQSLVVCSSTTEYEAAATRERLALHTAVVVQPLSREQVNTHLTSIGKPLAALRAALRKNTALRELATTPLMLQVLMHTYHGTSVRELPHKEAQLREQIWADYVQRMVSRKGNAKRYPLNVTNTWLSWLARQMRQHNQTVFYLERLQPDWLPKRRRAFYRLSVVLVIGLVVGLLVGLVVGLVIGLVIGLLVGLVVGLTDIEPGPDKLRSLLGESSYELFSILGDGLGAGLGLGLVFVLLGWLGLGVGLLLGLLLGLLVGLLVVLNFGLLVGLGRLLGWLGAAVQHYILRFWLSCTHTLPWKAVPFLEDATTRTLLRRVGGGYSFIHQLLLDHFADLEQDAA